MNTRHAASLVGAVTVAFLALAEPSHGGFDLDMDPKGIKYDGEPFSAGQKQQVEDALTELEKVEGKEGCARCLREMLNAASPKIDLETSATANAVAGANTLRGPDAACNDGTDAINVNPVFFQTSQALLKAALAHEWCHTVQPSSQTEDLELPCYEVEIDILKKNRTAANKAEVDRRIKQMRDLANSLKKDGTVGDSRTPQGGGAIRFSLQEGASYSVAFPRPFLLGNLLAGPGRLDRFRLRGPDGKPILPFDLQIIPGSSLPSGRDTAVVSGVDPTRKNGVITAMEVGAGTVMTELVSLQLAGSHPLSLAFDSRTSRLFVLDTMQNRVL
jgi:hypothetical protein